MKYDKNSNSRIIKQQALCKYKLLKKQKQNQSNLSSDDELFVQNFETAMYIWGANLQFVKEYRE